MYSAPHLTKRGDYYYIMCAEGGTGYHSVTGAGQKYLGDPISRIFFCTGSLTSSPGDLMNGQTGIIKTQVLQSGQCASKSGHASYVDLSNGEDPWMVI